MKKSIYLIILIMAVAGLIAFQRYEQHANDMKMAIEFDKVFKVIVFYFKSKLTEEEKLTYIRESKAKISKLDSIVNQSKVSKYRVHLSLLVENLRGLSEILSFENAKPDERIALMANFVDLEAEYEDLQLYLK